jgi:hypothetical protein
MSNEERLKILKMVSDGILSIDEAEKLLDVLDDKKSTDQQSTAVEENWAVTGKKGKWLRIIVSEANSGNKKVNLRIPSSLISAGLKIASKYAPEMQGIDANEIMNALNQDVQGKFIDVEDGEDGEHVEIYIE